MKDVTIRVDHVSKVYRLYEKPRDRIKEAFSLRRKTYYREHFALQDVSFEVGRGETVGIIGTNGAGKSTILKIITGVLSQTSGEVAVNGRLAVDMFAEHPAGYYDAILMDMRMPEMDGLEATKAIRAMDREDAKKIPIIALTANAFDEDVQRSMQAGLNAHLSKPVEPDILFETLENLL